MPAPTLSTLVLGLGLFFLGIQLIGMSLRQLAGPSFGTLVRQTIHSSVLASLVGVMFGALMQSATAVTFILAGLVSTGLIEVVAALPIIVWCNVGLTALAFVTTLDIHPLVAWLVGGAGITSGLLRHSRRRAAAGVLLGMGLTLFGLESMSRGAAPLAAEPWFRAMLSTTLGHPLLAFATGIVAAACLQSNTGAAMLVITLAATGLFPLHEAVLLIYGSNLGTIVLRAVLALGLRSTARRLVRMEDLFCVVSGASMLALDILESTGVPLVRAGVQHLTSDIRLQLALVFLLSNLLPALALTPALGWCAALLERLVPADAPGAPGTPRYLTPQALGDPDTAILLLEKELARLLGMLSVGMLAEANPADGEHEPNPAFVELGLAIERFAVQLATRGTPSEAQAARVQSLRGALSTIRHLEDALADVSVSLRRLGDAPVATAVARDVTTALDDLLRQATAAAEHLVSDEVAALLERTRKRGPLLEGLRATLDAERAALPEDERLHVAALLNDVEVAVWMVHRLAKILATLAAPAR